MNGESHQRFDKKSERILCVKLEETIEDNPVQKGKDVSQTDTIILYIKCCKVVVGWRIYVHYVIQINTGGTMFIWRFQYLTCQSNRT